MKGGIRLKRKPQEIPLDHPDSRWRFTGQLVAVPAALNAFGVKLILPVYLILQTLAWNHDGIDYLQVFENPTGADSRLWFIDDETHVTALLPLDY